jgi:hypothetical protein
MSATGSAFLVGRYDVLTLVVRDYRLLLDILRLFIKDYLIRLSRYLIKNKESREGLDTRSGRESPRVHVSVMLVCECIDQK